MAANILINQGVLPAGVASTSRIDLALAAAVNLTNNNNAGVVTWLWELLDRPVGSAAAIAVPGAAATSFTPDIWGPYRVRLTVNGGGSGNVDTRVAAVRSPNRGWTPPAFLETREMDTVQDGAVVTAPGEGWNAGERSMEFILRDLEANVVTTAPLFTWNGIDFSQFTEFAGADVALSVESVIAGPPARMQEALTCTVGGLATSIVVQATPVLATANYQVEALLRVPTAGEVGLVSHFIDLANYYSVRLDSIGVLTVRKRVAGVDTVLFTLGEPLAFVAAADGFVASGLRLDGGIVRLSFSPRGAMADTALAGAGRAGMLSFGSAPGPQTFQAVRFRVVP